MVSGGLATIEAKLNSILTKVDSMPLEDMASDSKAWSAHCNQTLKQADIVLSRIDTELVPEGTKTSRRCIEPLRMRTALFSVKTPPTTQDLHDMLQELTDTARSMRIFVDYLQQHPSMLIRGKKEEHP